MAQQDATEQVKEVLRQVIKYRFWIAVSFAALFAVIAYFMGSGPVKAQATKEINDITSAEKGVEQYKSNSVPTEQYKPIVEERTQLEDKDVTKAWKELYDRQAPLLTWPEAVKLRGNLFRKWGRKWPENEDPGKVQLAYVDYGHAYKDYVDLVFKTFHPFDYETGEGIVASPPKEVLLRPVQFSDEERPDLGKIWAAQERLWLQRTVLEVVAEVNKAAKDWDTAIIKEIESIEVGNPTAQDQKSLANNQELKKADEILAPGQESAAAAAEAGGGPGGGMSMAGGSSMASGQGMARRGAMGGMGGMAGMGGPGASGGPASGSEYDDTIYSITPEVDKGQYRILPVRLTVLIDQDRVQDLLVALENSPMSIQVMETELSRPQSRVSKPEKGKPPAGANMMGGMMGMMRMMSGGHSGYGGMMSQMDQQMRMQMSQYGMSGGRNSMMGGGYGGGMGGASTAKRKGTDVRNIDRGAKRKETEKAVEEKKGPSLFDPYFAIVEVTIYGRARFFNAPTAEPAAEPSLGETPAPAAPGATPPAGPAAASQENAPAAPPAGTKADGANASPKPAGAPAEGMAPAKAAPEKPADKPADTAKPDGKAAAPAKAAPEKPADKPADTAKPDGKAAAPKS